MKTYLKILSALLIVFPAITSCTKKPTACCNFSATDTVGQVISFSSSCSTDASKYTWEFGDGASSSDANPTHAYTKAGIYTVKFMAMSNDESKMDETSKPITIK